MIKNKKAISVMVSYTLLIIIAIGLSVAVYSYLKIKVTPLDLAECSSERTLIMEQITCSGVSGGEKNLSITFSNRGLFNVPGAFIRMGKPYRTVRPQVNQNLEFFTSPLSPGNRTTYLYDITTPINDLGGSKGNYTIEIQPAIIKKGKLIPCKSVVTQNVECIW